MSKIPQDIIDRTQELGSKLAGPQMTIDLARLYSQKTRIQSGQPGLRSWRKEESLSNLHDAESLIEAAALLRSQKIAGWRRYYRRAAEILEWLSDAKAIPSDIPIALLSAAAYQLAGYPARAHGVLSELPDNVGYSRIVQAFLKGDFKQLQLEIADYWRANPRQEIDPNNSIFETLIIEETISALGVMSSFIRWGYKDRLNKAISKLEYIEKNLLNTRYPYSWLLSRMLAEIASDYVQSAIRNNLYKVQDQLSQGGSYAIERYSRLAYIDSTSLAWPSQLMGLKKIEEDTSFALCTPTGSGKTRIAEIAIIRALFGDYDENEIPIVLYLVCQAHS